MLMKEYGHLGRKLFEDEGKQENKE